MLAVAKSIMNKTQANKKTAANKIIIYTKHVTNFGCNTQIQPVSVTWTTYWKVECFSWWMCTVFVHLLTSCVVGWPNIIFTRQCIIHLLFLWGAVLYCQRNIVNTIDYHIYLIVSSRQLVMFFSSFHAA